jgi:O-antigen/teichoic acid export membrane protein
LGVVLVLKTVVQRLDVIVLSAVRSPSEVALYVAAARYLVLGQVVNRAMNWTLQPRVAAAVAAGDRAGVRSAYRAATAWLVLISWPVSIGCVLFPGALMEILGGRAFRSGSAILVVLAASMLVAAACGNVESVIAMVGRSRLNLGLAVVATVVNVGLLALLVPGHGGLGAAYAWAGAVLVSNVLPTVVLATLERLTPIGRSVAVAMGVSVASTAVVGGIVRFALGDSLVALVVAVPLCAVAHVLLVARSRRALHLDGLRPARAGRRATRAS